MAYFNLKKYRISVLIVILLVSSLYSGDSYENFNTTVYSRVYETMKMGDIDWLDTRFEMMNEHIKIDKVYLETHRDTKIVSQETLDKVKNYFDKKGIKTSGGITLTIDEGNRFETYCYTTQEDREKVREIIEFTAKNFDELILDDFFFTNCKCESCIEAKGDQSWTDFRLELMTEAAQELVLEPAREVNPDVKVIIKYPNWYEHFQGLGFNLETQPEMFDALYTGTETRNPDGNQHLQVYQSYGLVRYFDNLKPGKNDGGWVDTGGLVYLDRYAEQMWGTLFAKAPELNLFDFRQLQYEIKPELKGDWQDQETSFDYEQVLETSENAQGKWEDTPTMAMAAGQALSTIDKYLGELGEPVGIPSYKPFHSTGEDYLQSYLGMIGIPNHIVSEFPMNDGTVILTKQASFDSDIVNKIERKLKKGGKVILTSGLVKELEDRELDKITGWRDTEQKGLVNRFRKGYNSYHETEEKMLISQLEYFTNESWEEVSAMDGTDGYPMLLSDEYGKGEIYAITVPDNYTDYYRIPKPILSSIKKPIVEDMFVRLRSPGKVSIFVYNNNTFVVESFRDETADIGLVTDGNFEELKELTADQTLSGETLEDGNDDSEEKVFKTSIKPHSFKVFKAK